MGVFFANFQPLARLHPHRRGNRRAVRAFLLPQRPFCPHCGRRAQFAGGRQSVAEFPVDHPDLHEGLHLSRHSAYPPAASGRYDAGSADRVASHAVSTKANSLETVTQ